MNTETPSVVTDKRGRGLAQGKEGAAERTRSLLAEVGEHPGDECLLGILCRQIEHLVRPRLVAEARGLRPWYTPQQRLVLLGKTFGQAYARIVGEARAATLPSSALSDPTGYIERVFADEFASAMAEGVPAGEAPPLIQLQQGRFQEGLARALTELPENARNLLHLRLKLNYSVAEISQILERPPVAVQLDLESAVRRLKEIMGA